MSDAETVNICLRLLDKLRVTIGNHKPAAKILWSLGKTTLKACLQSTPSRVKEGKRLCTGHTVEAVQTFTCSDTSNQINTSNSCLKELGWFGLFNVVCRFPLKDTNEQINV